MVTKITGRGTSSRKAEPTPMNWAGDDYRKVQQERIAKVGKNLTLALGRGDRKLSIKDLPEPTKRPSTEGMTRITNRGTASRKSTNRGMVS